jgi:hypothetical protein
VLNRCTFTNNGADHGGALVNYQGTSTLTDCTFTQNSSTVQGGGPLFFGGSATLTNCNVSNNNGSRAGGLSVLNATVQLVNCTVSGNTARTTHGGGLYNFRGNLTLTNCTISGNSAPGTPAAPGVGGGLVSYGGQTTLTNCTVSGNSAGWGGGLHAALTTVNLVNSTVSGNTATGTGDGGGGVANDRSNVTLTNCTLSGNSGSVGGGLWLSGTSSSALATATLVNCTVSGNTASYGGGLYRGFHATLTLGNTIVAGNTATTRGPDVDAPVTSLGHNLIGKADSSIGWISGSDMWGTSAAPLNPLLAPLGYYGGPTQTMPLLPGSPALDAGSNSERQDITVSGSSGTFKLTFDGKTTGALAYNATASAVQDALNALASIGGVGGSVTVIKVGTVFQVTFAGTLANQDLAQMTAAGSGAATATVLTFVNGINIPSDQRGFARAVNGTVDIGAFESSGFTIAVVSGNGQSAGTNTNFLTLLVQVTANNALEPVAGGLVTFTAPTTGASASFNGTTATTVTAAISATGRASVTAKANKTLGSYTVKATASGIANLAIFSLTNKKQGT